eukprot:gene24063-9637_t
MVPTSFGSRDSSKLGRPGPGFPALSTHLHLGNTRGRPLTIRPPSQAPQTVRPGEEFSRPTEPSVGRDNKPKLRPFTRPPPDFDSQHFHRMLGMTMVAAPQGGGQNKDSGEGEANILPNDLRFLILTNLKETSSKLKAEVWPIVEETLPSRRVEKLESKIAFVVDLFAVLFKYGDRVKSKDQLSTVLQDHIK